MFFVKDHLATFFWAFVWWGKKQEACGWVSTPVGITASPEASPWACCTLSLLLYELLSTLTLTTHWGWKCHRSACVGRTQCAQRSILSGSRLWWLEDSGLMNRNCTCPLGPSHTALPPSWSNNIDIDGCWFWWSQIKVWRRLVLTWSVVCKSAIFTFLGDSSPWSLPLRHCCSPWVYISVPVFPLKSLHRWSHFN